MRKQEFLALLCKGMSGLPQEDMEERLVFYSEMIDDRMEEGLSEEQAVSSVGPVDEILVQIVSDIPPAKMAKEIINAKRRLKAWEIVLLVLGSPIWFSLLVAAFAVIFSIYVSLWSVLISLWTVFLSVVACALGGVIAGLGFALGGHGLTGIAVIGSGVICAGLAIFLFYGCKAATKGSLLLTKNILPWMKRCCMKKEEV